MPAGPYSEKTRWSADKDGLIVRPMEDVLLVFHKLSGDTHILNFLSAAIVDVLSQGSETFASAEPKILRHTSLTAEDCPPRLIKETILLLDDIGLVRPQAPGL